MNPNEYLIRLLLCVKEDRKNTIEVIKDLWGIDEEKAEIKYKTFYPLQKRFLDTLTDCTTKETVEMHEVINVTYLANNNASVKFIYFKKFNEELPTDEEIERMFPK